MSRVYAITDGIGYMPDDEMRIGYKRAIELANGIETVTLKYVCEKNYEALFHRQLQYVSDKMKSFNRFTLKPQKVYVICSEFNDSVKSKADMWLENDRDIKVYVIETAHIEPQVSRHTREEKCYGVNNMSKARRCALIWGNALGWSFSAPLVRDPKFIVPDTYTKRTNISVFGSVEHHRLSNTYQPNNTYVTGKYESVYELPSFVQEKLSKPSFTNKAYITSNIELATEAECEAFYQHYAYYQKNGLLAEMLEPGYKLCPHCGRPYRYNGGTALCTWCDTELETVDETAYGDTYFYGNSTEDSFE